ncbi:hypothetical protein [Streptomyces xanthophaeus]
MSLSDGHAVHLAMHVKALAGSTVNAITECRKWTESVHGTGGVHLPGEDPSSAASDVNS